jgi:hypothetical protein
MEERSYFFRLSKYRERLVEHIKTHPEFVQPEMRRNFILGEPAGVQRAFWYTLVRTRCGVCLCVSQRGWRTS